METHVADSMFGRFIFFRNDFSNHDKNKYKNQTKLALMPTLKIEGGARQISKSQRKTSIAWLLA